MDSRAETLRRCRTCSHEAVVCVDARRYVINGIIPSGTVYQHACQACGRKFKSESPWRTVMSMVMAAIPMSLCVLMVFTAMPYLIAPDPSYRRAAGHTNWELYTGLGAAFLLMSIAIVASSAWRIFELWRNPAARPSSNVPEPGPGG